MPPFQYEWSTGILVQNPTGLIAGTYGVTVTDSNGCISTEEGIVSEPQFEITLDTLAHISCSGYNNGIIGVTAMGSTPSYSYAWSNGSNGPIIYNLPAGIYTVTAYDGNNCEKTKTFSLVEQANLTFSPIFDEITCFGDDDGSILIASDSVIGGTPPYIVFLNNDTLNQQTITENRSALFSGLSVGSYQITLIDQNNCTTFASVDFPSISPVEVDLGSDETIYLGQSVVLNPYTNIPDWELLFDWSEHPSLDLTDTLNPIATPLQEQTYVLVVTDQRGCLGSDEIIIHVEKDLKVKFPTAFSPNNDGHNDLFYPRSHRPDAIQNIPIFRVFDRWGELVYECRDLLPNQAEAGWDGTFRSQLLTPAVFVYFAQVQYIDGTTEFLEGDVTLIR